MAMFSSAVEKVRRNVGPSLFWWNKTTRKQNAIKKKKKGSGGLNEKHGKLKGNLCRKMMNGTSRNS